MKRSDSVLIKRKTFRDILVATRIDAAHRAWDRAEFASRCRKLVMTSGRRRDGRRLSKVKYAAIARARELAPELVHLGLDGDYQIGLPSIRMDGRGRLHVSNEFIRKDPVWQAAEAMARVAVGGTLRVWKEQDGTVVATAKGAVV